MTAGVLLLRLPVRIFDQAVRWGLLSREFVVEWVELPVGEDGWEVYEHGPMPVWRLSPESGYRVRSSAVITTRVHLAQLPVEERFHLRDTLRGWAQDEDLLTNLQLSRRARLVLDAAVTALDGALCVRITDPGAP